MSEPSAAQTWDGAVLASALGLTAFGVLMNYSTTAALEIGATLPPLAVRHAAGVAFALVLRGARGAPAARVLAARSRSGCGRARVALLVRDARCSASRRTARGAGC